MWARWWGDVAWGGNWFFCVKNLVEDLSVKNEPYLTNLTISIRDQLQARNVTGTEGCHIDHIELYAPARQPENHSRNFVLTPGGSYDRSPCGTGTSAKLACLAADGKWQPGETWRQESVVGSVFECSYQADGDRVIPTITGQAYISGESTLILDPTDPYCTGIVSVSPSGETVVVIGGGIIGTMCGWYLQQAGQSVTLVDSGAFGAGCSHGNCGYCFSQPRSAANATRCRFNHLQGDDGTQLSIVYQATDFHPVFGNGCGIFPAIVTRPICSKRPAVVTCCCNPPKQLYQQLITEQEIDCEWEERGILFVFDSAEGVRRIQSYP